MKKKLKAPAGYKLASVIRSHGWSGLHPFTVEAPTRISFGARDGESAVDVAVYEDGGAAFVSAAKVTPTLVASVRRMFRMDDDLGDFYAHARKHRRDWIEQRQMGRMLRAQTVFEDVVKMVLTTNCSWAFTKKMVGALVETLGERTPGGVGLFPTPEKLASKGEKFYRDKIRAGYRSPHLAALGKIFARSESAQPLQRREGKAPDRASPVREGRREPLMTDRWFDSSTDTLAIRKEILSLPGAGPYVADNILKLVGRYDYLGIDSWVRAQLGKDDKAIQKAYAVHGPYRGLILWCDVTKGWFE